jgi:hypothetical protein
MSSLQQRAADVDLAKRAAELAEEAEQLRSSDGERSDADKKIADSIRALRGIAKS